MEADAESRRKLVKGRRRNAWRKIDYLKIFVYSHGNCQRKTWIHERNISKPQQRISVERFCPDKPNLLQWKESKWRERWRRRRGKIWWLRRIVEMIIHTTYKYMQNKAFCASTISLHYERIKASPVFLHFIVHFFYIITLCVFNNPWKCFTSTWSHSCFYIVFFLWWPFCSGH